MVMQHNRFGNCDTVVMLAGSQIAIETTFRHTRRVSPCRITYCLTHGRPALVEFPSKNQTW